VPGRAHAIEKFVLPVSHVLHQNETTAGWQDPKKIFHNKSTHPNTQVPVSSRDVIKGSWKEISSGGSSNFLVLMDFLKINGKGIQCYVVS
jgi:hypothetical protein